MDTRVYKSVDHQPKCFCCFALSRRSSRSLCHYARYDKWLEDMVEDGMENHQEVDEYLRVAFLIKKKLFLVCRTQICQACCLIDQSKCTDSCNVRHKLMKFEFAQCKNTINCNLFWTTKILSESCQYHFQFRVVMVLIFLSFCRNNYDRNVQ